MSGSTLGESQRRASAGDPSSASFLLAGYNEKLDRTHGAVYKEAMPALTLRTVNFDCSDTHAMTRFYGGLFGWEPTVQEPGWVLMRDPQGGTGVSFQETDGYQPPTWPEERGRQQKMLHLEVRVRPQPGEEPQAALQEAVRLALSVGGTLATRQARPDLRVILDPSGHPLCLFLD